MRSKMEVVRYRSLQVYRIVIVLKKVTNPKIEDFSSIYLERRKHLRFHKRDALSVKNLLKYFTGKNLESILPSDIEDYIKYRLNSQKSNATIN